MKFLNGRGLLKTGLLKTKSNKTLCLNHHGHNKFKLVRIYKILFVSYKKIKSKSNLNPYIVLAGLEQAMQLGIKKTKSKSHLLAIKKC